MKGEQRIPNPYLQNNQKIPAKQSENPQADIYDMSFTLGFNIPTSIYDIPIYLIILKL